MALDPPTEGVLKSIRAVLDVEEEKLKQTGKELKEWLNAQPHLPSYHDEHMLQQQYLRCKQNMKNTKTSLDLYYSLKNSAECLQDRDPRKPWFDDLTKRFCFFPMPKLTDDYHRITIGRIFNHPEPGEFDINDLLKMCFMVHELRYLEEFTPFEIYVLDVKNATLSQALKFSFPVIRIISVVLLKRYGVILKSMHIVNAPLFVDIVLSIMKLVLKPKIYNKIHIHRNGLGNLLDNVDSKYLPSEFGGYAGSAINFWDEWKQRLINEREWFLEHDKHRTDETKRPTKRSIIAQN